MTKTVFGPSVDRALLNHGTLVDDAFRAVNPLGRGSREVYLPPWSSGAVASGLRSARHTFTERQTLGQVIASADQWAGSGDLILGLLRSNVQITTFTIPYGTSTTALVQPVVVPFERFQQLHWVVLDAGGAVSGIALQCVVTRS